MSQRDIHILDKEVTKSNRIGPLIWCLIVMWAAYSGLMLWHVKAQNGWVASICRTT